MADPHDSGLVIWRCPECDLLQDEPPVVEGETYCIETSPPCPGKPERIPVIRASAVEGLVALLNGEVEWLSKSEKVSDQVRSRELKRELAPFRPNPERTE